MELVLTYSKEDYILKQSTLKMLQGRALYELMQNEFVDVIWSMTSVEREKKLTPIRVPLYKGLIGSRLLLINSKDRSKFKDIHSKKELLQFYAGQGHDWPDTYILKNNDLPVVTSANYEGLFGMLLLDRFDYFPRSIIEIWDEAQAHISDKIVVEPNLLIQYPTASYFFVNKKNKRLANALEKGMETIIQNGEFDKLFYKYHGNFIKKAQLESRTIIKLDNPILPVETPLNNKKLWMIY